jgi:hypothetical protein
VSVFFIVTHSVIYIHTVGVTQKVSTGDYLGELTDEFGVGSYIEECVGWPKELRIFSLLSFERTTDNQV